MNKIIFIFVICISVSFLYAQDINKQIEFTVDNDKAVDEDKYYTSGLFLKYKKKLNTNFIFKKDSTNILQFNAIIGNETYTPTNLSNNSIIVFDRPFAGWFFLRFEIANIKNQSALLLALETGITGKASQSGNLQRWYHTFLGIDDNPTWEQEIPFKVLINFKAKYSFNKRLNKSTALQNTTSSAIGFKDIYLANDLDYFFGKLNVFQNSTRIGLIDTTVSNELYGFIGLGYKYVLHNTLIEGSLFNNEQTFISEIMQHLVLLRAGMVIKRKKNTFKLALYFNSKETPKSVSHTYGSLSYSRDF